MFMNWGMHPWSTTDHFSVFDNLRREMERLMHEVEHGSMLGAPSLIRSRGAQPDMRVSAAEDALDVYADMPGVSDDDIEVTIEESTLTIRGERKVDAPEGYTVHHSERLPMTFTRTLTLPYSVDADGVTATLRDGVLTIHMPRVAEERPRHIEVHAA